MQKKAEGKERSKNTPNHHSGSLDCLAGYSGKKPQKLREASVGCNSKLKTKETHEDFHSAGISEALGPKNTQTNSETPSEKHTFSA